MDSVKIGKGFGRFVVLPVLVLAALGIYLFSGDDGAHGDKDREDKGKPAMGVQGDTSYQIPEKPSGKVVLTVVGAVKNTNTATETGFDRAMLQSFPQISHIVTTPWTEGETVFTGPLLIDVLRHLGLDDSRVISATALNNYEIEIPVEDARKYPVILALTQNGNELRVRDKGPVWVIYPWTAEYPELKSETYHSRSIWQLQHIGIK